MRHKIYAQVKILHKLTNKAIENASMLGVLSGDKLCGSVGVDSPFTQKSKEVFIFSKC